MALETGVDSPAAFPAGDGWALPIVFATVKAGWCGGGGGWFGDAVGKKTVVVVSFILFC